MMPQEQPLRRGKNRGRKPTRNRSIRTLGPATVRITETGKIKVMHDDPALDKELRFDLPKEQFPE